MFLKSKKVIFPLIFALSIVLTGCTSNSNGSQAIQGVATQAPAAKSQSVSPVTITSPQLVASPTPKPKTITSINCLNGTYINSVGNTICRPEQSSTVPTGATAICRDGSYSFSQSRRGTCSYHGGVAQWL